jgi:hypothetical protein
MHCPSDYILKERSFDHKGRIYDVAAFVPGRLRDDITVEVTCNGKDVIFSYPDGSRMIEKRILEKVGGFDRDRSTSLNAVDYAMDLAEQHVRYWVA